MSLGVIHVAGVIDQAEADLLIECGVKFLGFPFELAKHKEDLSKEEAAEIIASLKADTTAFLITYLSEPRQIIALCKLLGVSYLQLHGDIAAEQMDELKTLWPEIRIIKSLVVRGENLAELERQIEATAAYVDRYITDTFDPETGATGATGKVHDWGISRRLVEVSPHPVILGGGLNPDNVRDAIRQVRPYGVDVHTGIEGPDGRKDRLRTRKFVSEANAAFTELQG